MINRLKKFLCAGLIGASLIFGSAVEAGVVTDRLPLTCYCEKRVNTYNGPGGNAVGYISANVDLIQVTQVRGDGWAYGSYPTSRGRVSRWFRISDLCADVNYSNRSANVRGNQTVFRTRNGGDTIGSVSNNESVIVIADNGSRAQIVYRLDNGTGYKMGWVASSAVPSNSSNPTRNVQAGYAMLNDGWYKISPLHATNRVLDVDAASTAEGANIQLWDNNASESQPNQVFYLRNVGNNWFTLKAGHCDLNVAAANTGGGLRTNVQLASPNPNSAAQLWRLVYSSTQGAYYIESRIRDRLAFDCADTGSGNGTNIWLWEYGDVNWNKWRFTPVRPPQNSQTSPQPTPIVQQSVIKPMKNMRLTNAQMGWGTYNSARRNSNRQYHLAIDVYGDTNDVCATATGTVKACSNSNSGANGRFVVIEHNIGGRTCYSFYAHLNSINVSIGQTVSAGQKIGVMGGSGDGRNDRYGAHLHFAIVDSLWTSGGYYGYAPKFSGNSTFYDRVTYYNPWYVLENQRLP